MGYETANYTFVPDGPDKRIRLRLSSATETLIDASPVKKTTLCNALPFAKSPGYFRLLFLAEDATSSRITRAILLSAFEEAGLERAVIHRPRSADEFCATLSSPGVTCTVFPKNFGVSPELPVRVNRQGVFVRVGGMVQDVLPSEISDTGPPASLKISRPFRGRLIPMKFDMSNRDILNFILLPCDQVTF
jgi:hypothetical protein